MRPASALQERPTTRRAPVSQGETADEVFGLADAMRDRAVKVDCSPHSVVDIVGTGGDGIGSVNISTGACIIAAAAGARVAKHGSRSSSSLCGCGHARANPASHRAAACTDAVTIP